jgi:hypothetical protein
MQGKSDGVDPKRLQFVTTIRPRTGEVMNVCVGCQEDFSESQFSVSGAVGDSGGAWDRARQAAAVQAQVQQEASDMIEGEAGGMAGAEEGDEE